jgi:exodeoxyribonuclease VIII
MLATQSGQLEKVLKGGIFDISNELYHAGPGISRSGIVEFKKSPKHYWHRYINPYRQPKETTAEMAFGTMFHMYVLEPELFDNHYYVSVKCPHHGSSNLAKEYKKAEEKKAAGRAIILDTELALIKEMTNGLFDHPKAFSLITGAQYEKSIYWIDKESGLLCKARPDILNMQGKFVVDLKTTRDASKRKFSYDFKDGGNYIQSAMIREGIKEVTGETIESFVNLAVEKVEPFCAAHYPVNNLYVDLGEQEFKHYLLEIKKCMEANEWPSYPDDEINIPQNMIQDW